MQLLWHVETVAARQASNICLPIFFKYSRNYIQKVEKLNVQKWKVSN